MNTRLSDLDVKRADRLVAAELARELAPAMRPRRCECRAPLVDSREVGRRCILCGREVT
jgi:hypothetical protein